MNENFELFIDTREKHIISQLKKLDCTFTVKNLDIGDILVTKKTPEEDEVIVKVIERKTVTDLKQSIIDGRLKEQKQRILSCVNSNQIVYLIEGDLYTNSLNNMRKNILGSITSMQHKENISVYKTKNVSESCDWIINLYEKIKKSDDCIVKPTTYENKIFKVKKNNITKVLLYKNFLTSIPQISDKIADVLIASYPSLKNLMENFDVNTVSNITYPIANNRQRKIGKVISERISTFIN